MRTLFWPKLQSSGLSLGFKTTALGLIAVFVLAGVLLAGSEEKSVPEFIARGEELFMKKEGLGVKYACIMCHKQEKAIQRSKVELAGDGLPDVINKYVLEKAKGKPLARDSEDMKALIAYVKYKHSI